MVKIEKKVKLSPILTDSNYLRRHVEKALDEASDIVVASYKFQIPVDSGTARQNVRAKKTGKLEYTVNTKAVAGGYNYPELVYFGTMDWRGSRTDIGRINRVRRGYVNRSGRRGIQPNKFADRAKESAEPKVIRYIKKEIGNVTR